MKSAEFYGNSPDYFVMELLIKRFNLQTIKKLNCFKINSKRLYLKWNFK